MRCSRRFLATDDDLELRYLDQIRPDWEDKLAAVKAAVARRANRRIIMRQVGDRLIPVGVTSGRIHAIDDPSETGEESSGRRSRRRPPQSAELSHLLQSMGIGMGGQDLEEVRWITTSSARNIEHVCSSSYFKKLCVFH